jgi:hypothetical protein
VIVVVARDLIIFSRIADAAGAGMPILRIDDPADLPGPEQVRLAFVDWGDRRAAWSAELQAWLRRAGETRPRLVLFGPHTDRQAHADARAAGLGPMLARSRLIATLPALVAA